MGKSKNANLAHGTRGNPQYTLEQEKAELKARELAEKDKIKIFDHGHVTLESISRRREFFLRQKHCKNRKNIEKRRLSSNKETI